jgi:hypothetical protein
MGKPRLRSRVVRRRRLRRASATRRRSRGRVAPLETPSPRLGILVARALAVRAAITSAWHLNGMPPTPSVVASRTSFAHLGMGRPGPRHTRSDRSQRAPARRAPDGVRRSFPNFPRAPRGCGGRGVGVSSGATAGVARRRQSGCDPSQRAVPCARAMRGLTHASPGLVAPNETSTRARGTACEPCPREAIPARPTRTADAREASREEAGVRDPPPPAVHSDLALSRTAHHREASREGVGVRDPHPPAVTSDLALTPPGRSPRTRPSHSRWKFFGNGNPVLCSTRANWLGWR